eukprot:Nk52_evm9s371 gene=Nk52_evmTU9s371
MADDAEDLLRMFSSMGTTDHEVLMSQFQQISKCESPDTCRFFLEANNWSLQTAIASFFDHGGTAAVALNRTQKPEMQFLYEVDANGFPINTDQQYFYPVNSKVVKYWRLKNVGETNWPAASSLEFIGGSQLQAVPTLQLPPLPPGQEVTVAIEFIMPSQPGNVASCWRMCCSEGVPMMIGEPLWVILEVIEQAAMNFSGGMGAEDGHQQMPFSEDTTAMDM